MSDIITTVVYVGWRVKGDPEQIGTTIVRKLVTRSFSEPVAGEEPITRAHALRHLGSKSSRAGKLFFHSPAGFEYGYLGSGPADLALAIIGDTLGDSEGERASDRAWALHQSFKQEFIGYLPRDQPWVIAQDAVRTWIAEYEESRRQVAEAVGTAAVLTEGGQHGD